MLLTSDIDKLLIILFSVYYANTAISINDIKPT